MSKTIWGFRNKTDLLNKKYDNILLIANHIIINNTNLNYIYYIGEIHFTANELNCKKIGIIGSFNSKGILKAVYARCFGDVICKEIEISKAVFYGGGLSKNEKVSRIKCVKIRINELVNDQDLLIESKDAYINTIFNTGLFRVENIQCENIFSADTLDIGSISGNEIKIIAGYKPITIKSITGKKVTIGKYHIKSMKKNKVISEKKSVNTKIYNINSIKADDIYVDNIVCNNISGKNIHIGKNSLINEVYCSGNLTMEPGSVVSVIK